MSEIERLKKLYKEKPLKVRSDCCKEEMQIISIKNIYYNKCTKCQKLCNWIGDDEFENNIKKRLEEYFKKLKGKEKNS